MNIIGINLFCFNPSTALLKDSELIYFSEEERLNRIKNSFGCFPILSLKEALNLGQLELNDIDIIAVPWKPYSLLKNLTVPFLKKKILKPFGNFGKFSTFPYSISLTYKLFPFFLENLIKMELLNNFNTDKIPDIKFFSHHLCHATSSFCLSSFDNSLSIAFDGVGDRECSSSWYLKNNYSNKIHEKKFPHSLGEYYAGFTELFGFKAYQDEGKLMALASYGKKNQQLEDKIGKVLKITKDGYKVDSSYFHFGPHSYGYRFSDKLVSEFGGPFKIKNEFSDYEADLAWNIQNKLEQAAISFINYSLKIKNSDNLCFSGGVSHNCKLMGKIGKVFSSKKIFIIPASSDSGAAIGAAYLANKSKEIKFSKKYLNFGRSYKDDEIENFLLNNKINFKKLDVDKIIDITSEKIINNVGAIFSDSSESGSRSLCYRSIIANPIKNNIKEILNKKIKFRENWRPFGISILEEEAKNYLEYSHSNLHMTMAFDVKIDKQEYLKNVIHVDKTSRPQLIFEKENKYLHSLVKNFFIKTGCPAIINTSLNIKGEPIVENPKDAIRCFMTTPLDFMILNYKFLIEK